MKLYFGDCLKLLPLLPDKSVDVVISDLPYGTTNCRWDTPIDLNKLWPEYHRVCKGPFILFAQTPFDKVLGMSNIAQLKYEWIWEKTSPTGHLNAKRSPMKAHENILVFYSKQPKYFPIKTTGHARKTAVRKSIDLSSVYGKQRAGSFYDSTDRYPRSVIRFASDKQHSKLHPTQKPLALMEYLVQTYTQKGDVILDTCMGSGTTGCAAIGLDRDFIGMEKEKEFFDISGKRISQFALGDLV